MHKPCPFCKSTDLKFISADGPKGILTVAGIQCNSCGVCAHWIFEKKDVEELCWKLWDKRGICGKLMSILRFDK